MQRWSNVVATVGPPQDATRGTCRSDRRAQRLKGVQPSPPASLKEAVEGLGGTFDGRQSAPAGARLWSSSHDTAKRLWECSFRHCRASAAWEL
jgi:hypothetical protein